MFDNSKITSQWGRLSWFEKGCFVGVISVIVLAVVGPWIAPHDPYFVDLDKSLLPPNSEHWFGTDVDGRDILSRLLFGARSTLLAPLGVIVFAASVGTVIGTIAALNPGVVDELIMRLCDVGLAFPALVLSIGLASALGPSLRSAIIALALTWWPGYARLVRSLVLEVTHKEFIESAKVLGVPRRKIVFRHILPNALNAMYVQTTIDVSAVILVISGLSFIGAGAQPPSSEWGAMVTSGRDYMLTGWWTVVVPGIAISLTAMLFNLSGDALRVLNDPTLKQSRG